MNDKINKLQNRLAEINTDIDIHVAELNRLYDERLMLFVKLARVKKGKIIHETHCFSEPRMRETACTVTDYGAGHGFGQPI